MVNLGGAKLHGKNILGDERVDFKSVVPSLTDALSCCERFNLPVECSGCSRKSPECTGERKLMKLLLGLLSEDYSGCS